MNHIILIMFFFLTSALRAEETPFYEHLRIDEKKDYQFVIRSCHGNLNTLSKLVNSAKDDTVEDIRYFFSAGGDFVHQEGNLVTRKGLGKNTARLLNSKGYFYGLKTCFPKDENKRHQYTIKLLMFDALGKGAALGAIFLTGTTIYKSFAYLGRKLAVQPTVAVFRSLKASDEFLAKIPKYMGRAGIVTFNAVTLGGLAAHVYKNKKDREAMARIFAEPDYESLNKSLKENLELYYDAIELESKAQTPEQKLIAANLIKDQKDTVIFYLNSLLDINLPPEKKAELKTLKLSLDAEGENYEQEKHATGL